MTITKEMFVDAVDEIMGEGDDWVLVALDLDGLTCTIHWDDADYASHYTIIVKDGSIVDFTYEGNAEPDEDDCDPGDMDGDFDSAMASVGWGTDEDHGCYGGDEW